MVLLVSFTYQSQRPWVNIHLSLSFLWWARCSRLFCIYHRPLSQNSSGGKTRWTLLHIRDIYDNLMEFRELLPRLILQLLLLFHLHRPLELAHLTGNHRQCRWISRHQFWSFWCFLLLLLSIFKINFLFTILSSKNFRWNYSHCNLAFSQ